MFLFIITLLIVNAVVSHGKDYEKCCGFGEYLQKVNVSYECTENENKRLDILTNRTNFLERNSEGECLDISTDFFIYNISNRRVVEERPFLGEYFPKCCPLNYVYNSAKHSCDKHENLPYDFIKTKLVKVGLPNCKVIVDYELNGTIDFNYSLIDAVHEKSSTNSIPYPGSYCIDKNEKGTFVMRECKESLEICADVKCIKKCCPDGQSFINGSHCYDTYSHGLELSSFSVIERSGDPYAIIYNRTCPKIYMMKNDKYIFSLDDKGVYKYWNNLTESFVYEDIGHMNSYCIEHTTKPDIEGFFFFMCFPEKVLTEKFKYTVPPKIISCIFLILSVGVYLVLNETKKVFGKILVNYCIAMFIQFTALTYGQVRQMPTPTDCELTSFAIIFFATATFTWSNVICCDIWWTFGKSKIGSHQGREIKKLVLYFLYGWGMPTILTLIIFLFHTYRVLPYSIQPFMGVTKCYFERRKGNYGQMLFFNLPHLIIQLVNLILFIKTILYYLKVKDEINRIDDTTKDDKNKRFQKDKERLFLILKLSVIMGVSFIFEAVSGFFEMSKMGVVPKYIEVVWDCINCLQGLFIFIIFICKKKILQRLSKKFKIFSTKNTSKLSIHTQSTTTSHNGTSMDVLGPSNRNYS